MNHLRQLDFFDPSKHNASVTIVGCGGIGSFAALALAKLGVQRIALVDFDDVDEHNIPNQLYGPDQAGYSKVGAMLDSIEYYTGNDNVEPLQNPLQDGIPINDVVISALDSMTARKDLWELVKGQMRCKLFLDGRLGGENIVLYSVNPTKPSDQDGYEATLHSDAEGDDLPCTGRAIIDVGFAVASLITRAVRRYYTREPNQSLVYLNQNTLDIFKGGWS